AAPGLAPALLDGAHLSVAVDWLTGFTGHADVGLGHGIALATGTAAAVKPKPAGTGAGEQRQVVVNLTDDQLRALGLLDDDEDLTEEEITRAVEDLAPETPPPDPQSTGTPAPAQRKTEIAPDRGPAEARVGYGFGHQDHGARRTVRYVNALARSREDMEGSVREVSRLRRTLAEMPDGQWRAEEEEANRVIAEAGLTREQQQRLQAFLEVGPF